MVFSKMKLNNLCYFFKKSKMHVTNPIEKYPQTFNSFIQFKITEAGQDIKNGLRFFVSFESRLIFICYKNDNYIKRIESKFII